MATEAIIRRRIPIFDAVLSTSVPYDTASRILVEAFTPHPRFDSLFAFGFRYCGHMKDSNFWLRRVTDHTDTQNPTVMRGVIKGTPGGTQITLRASNPLRQLLNRAIVVALASVLTLILEVGTSAIYVGMILVLVVACIATGWYLLTPWVHGLRALRDLTALIDGTHLTAIASGEEP